MQKGGIAMDSDQEPLAGEPHNEAAATSKGTLGKVVGAIGIGLAALLGGLAKHGGHVGRGLRHAGDVGGSVVRHADDLGRGASHMVDDMGRGGLRRAGEIGGASHLTNDFGHGAAGMRVGASHDIRYGAGLENAPRFGDDVSRGYRPFGHELDQRYGPWGGDAGLRPASQRDLMLPRGPETRPQLPGADGGVGGARVVVNPEKSSPSRVHFPAARTLHAGQHAVRAGQHALRSSGDQGDHQDDQRAPAPGPRAQP